MAFTIKKMILHNRAPFEHIELNFIDKGITILNAVNGGGKTTILSHIADAWHEIVRNAYPGEFEGKEGKYYRVSSPMFSLDARKPSFVFIKFFDDEHDIDYLDFRGDQISSSEYLQIKPVDCNINYEQLKVALERSGSVKYCSERNIKTLQKLFQNNLVTFFPSYRHEQPGYLNEPFKIQLNYGLAVHYDNYLLNPIEVITGLPQLANWLMDVILDKEVTKDQLTNTLFLNINSVFSNTLSIKSDRKLSIGIGRRMERVTRIQIGERDASSGKWTKTVYPSIFNMSSGENALICLFCEIVKQFDNIKPSFLLEAATGIVLIDEIDKHLHIRMQKDVLPCLLQLFPNIQFIISSHSPFVSMGIEENSNTNPRTQILDLDNHGIIADLSATRVFAEGYEAMLEKNKNYKTLYEVIKTKFDSQKLQIISEGHNGEHIKKAIEILNNSLSDKIDFCFSDKTGWQQLKNAYDAISTSHPQAKYLFVFDCDCENSAVRQLIENNNFYWFIFEKNTENDKVKKGIENLYPIELFEEAHYPKKEKTDDYGGRITREEFDKNRFLSDIQSDTEASHFKNFTPLIEKIEEIVRSSMEHQGNMKGNDNDQV